MHCTYAILSQTFGWIYFSAWSVSFYPQILRNNKRKSVNGLSLDYVALNFTGFLCYTIFNVFMFACGDASVKLADLLFSLHATLTTSVVIFQIVAYKETDMKVSRAVIICLVSMIYVFLFSFMILAFTQGSFDVLLYMLSFTKMVLTLVKYIPQVVINHQTQSTIGWSIHNNTLDFIGGIFSVAQSILDSIAKDDWTIITHNPVKIALGVISMVFDVIFFIQHYIYQKNHYSEPLLAPEDFTYEI